MKEPAFTFFSSLIKDQLPAPRVESPDVAPGGTNDVTVLIGQLSSLGEAGALTDVKCHSKKAELLGRL